MKKQLTAALLACSVFLTGCMSITMHSTISPEGDLTMRMEYDMSQLIAMAKAEGDQTESNIGDLGSFCEGVQNGVDTKAAEHGQEFHGSFSCVEDTPGKFIVEVSSELDDSTFRRDGNIVKFNLGGTQQLIDKDTIMAEADSDQASQVQDMDPAMLALMGLRMEYIVTMPGQIIESPIGSINGDTVTINLLTEKMENKQDYWVIADLEAPITKTAPTIEPNFGEQANFLQLLQQMSAMEQAAESQNQEYDVMKFAPAEDEFDFEFDESGFEMDLDDLFNEIETETQNERSVQTQLAEAVQVLELADNQNVQINFNIENGVVGPLNITTISLY